MRASAAAITAGCSMWKATASISPASRKAASTSDNVRQPWYPVEERYGLVFAYMGPPEKKPVLPRWDTLENARPRRDDSRHRLEPRRRRRRHGRDRALTIGCTIGKTSWTRSMSRSCTRPSAACSSCRNSASCRRSNGNMPSHGMRYIAYRELDDGRKMDRITQALFPHARIVPDIRMKEGPAAGVGWVVPVDDTHFRLFHARKVPKNFQPVKVRHYENRIWSELTRGRASALPRRLGGAGRAGTDQPAFRRESRDQRSRRRACCAGCCSSRSRS